jgi:hypothetical protein
VNNGLAYIALELQSQYEVLTKFPQFLAENSPLRAKAIEIMEKNSEFKSTYGKSPKKLLAAVKMAKEILAGKSPAPKPKKKGNFIIGKGEGGEGSKSKKINLTDLVKTPEGRKKLDEIERKEFERIQGASKGK